MDLLVVHPSTGALPEGAADVLAAIGWGITTVDSYRAAIDATASGDIAAVLAREPGVPRGTGVGADPMGSAIGDAVVSRERLEFEEFVRHVTERRVAALLLTDRPSAKGVTRGDGLIDVVGRDISLDELRGRLAMIQRYHGMLRGMESQLDDMSRLGQRLKQHFQEVEQEMELAGRLQRDFLPDCDEPIGPARYAAVFRPASWVSGDTFDIVRIDEHHTGLYVADAVGHGLAAGLLTMFIKRAVTPKREGGGGYRLAPPSDILAGLNDALADQSLPNCQFVTACYALLDHGTLTLRCACGGHPPPMHIKHDGSMHKIEPGGGLLGLFKGERFEVADTQLEPGDKVLFYTDGLELVLQDGSDGTIDTHSFERAFQSMASLPIRDMLARIVERLDHDDGSLQPQDDITILGMEITP